LDKTDILDLKTAASVARFLSILSELQAINRDEDAIRRSEKVISALKEAAIGSCSIEKEKMVAIEKILAGMKEIWSSGHIQNEIGLRSSALAKSVELLMGGVCFAGEVVVFIYDALGSIEGALEDEKNGRDPSEQLENAASSLRKAEERFNAGGSDLGLQSAIQVGNAATIFEKLVGFGMYSLEENPIHIKDTLVCKSYKDALLIIGWVLLENALPAIDKADYIYAWDESMNLVEKGPTEHCDAAKKIQNIPDNNREYVEEQIIEELEVEPLGELVYDYEPSETCQSEKNIESPVIKEQIISNEPLVDAIAANECSLMPAMTQVIQYPGFSKVALLPEKDEKTGYKVVRFELAPNAIVSRKAGPEASEPIEPPAQTAGKDKGKAEPSAAFAQSSDSHFMADSSKGLQEVLYTFGVGSITKSNAINALKVLGVVVLGLLAIDVILYLI
jgi:hypothetical protein